MTRRWRDLFLVCGGGLMVMAIALGAVAGAATGAPLQPSLLAAEPHPPGPWIELSDTIIVNGGSTTMTVGGFPPNSVFYPYYVGINNEEYGVLGTHTMPSDGSPQELILTFGAAVASTENCKTYTLGARDQYGEETAGDTLSVDGTKTDCPEPSDFTPTATPSGGLPCCQSVAIDPAPVNQLFLVIDDEGATVLGSATDGFLRFYDHNGGLIQVIELFPSSLPGEAYFDLERGVIVVPSRTDSRLRFYDSLADDLWGDLFLEDDTVPWEVAGGATLVFVDEAGRAARHGVASPDVDLAVTGYGSNEIFLLDWPDGDGPPTITGDPISIPTGDSQPTGITFGPGNQGIYFLESAGNKVGRVLADLSIVEYDIPTPDSRPLNIALGADGNLWFTEFDGGKIGRMTPDGEIVEFNLSSSAGQPYDIVPGPGGIYFTAWGLNAVGFIPYSALPSIAGQIQSAFVPLEWRLPDAGAIPSAIIELDGAIWFIERGTSRLTKLNPARAHMPALFTALSAGW